jgi:uncharacterized protein Yka (UPF0111/DUF47 family)
VRFRLVPRDDGFFPLFDQAAGNLAEGARLLRDLLIAKLSKLRGIESELQAVDRLESEADRIYRRSVAHLFSGDFNAFDVLRWKDIVEAIEESVNGLEKISDIVEGIAIKHS